MVPLVGADDATRPRSGPWRGTFVVETTLAAGEHRDLLLEVSDRPFDRDESEPPSAAQLWDTTAQWWAAMVPPFEDTVSPRDARHAYAVLRGLTVPGGGMVAAATLGLPERAGGGRNYDYRYVWLRDQAYAGHAAAVDEPHPLLDDAVAYAVARILEHGPAPAPAYTVDGADLPRERRLDLLGYPGGSDVVGNHVVDQFQLDTVGEVLLLLARAAALDHLDGDGRRALELMCEVARDRWDEPDAGIWELDDDWWSQSRLAVVAGLRAAAAVSDRHRGGELATLADTILARTSERCLRPDGAWARSPGAAGTDASLLLAPVRGALPADDPRTRATLRAVVSELARDGFVYRFAPDERPLGEAEERSCSAASRRRWPGGTRATWRRRSAGSSGRPPRAARPACSPRSTTSPSGGSAATCRRRSCTRRCSRRRSAWRVRRRELRTVGGAPVGSVRAVPPLRRRRVPVVRAHGAAVRDAGHGQGGAVPGAAGRRRRRGGRVARAVRRTRVGLPQ
ncbi:hypothetical protein GCM10025864_15780 [Luteimicrobium album]|uniref:GH15-like domain-containing protein n=1 Tax=Luteimicrobium album TaxID=1054550 RepID=A0ABQ6I1J7_9MICO|nr:hypothetical protein GCM10025864_15780 [Luteimicrobium album]